MRRFVCHHEIPPIEDMTDKGSFPRKRESRGSKEVPAFAGMTKREVV